MQKARVAGPSPTSFLLTTFSLSFSLDALASCQYSEWQAREMRLSARLVPEVVLTGRRNHGKTLLDPSLHMFLYLYFR